MNELSVDPRPGRGIQVAQNKAASLKTDFGVAPGDVRVCQHQVIVELAAHGHQSLVEREVPLSVNNQESSDRTKARFLLGRSLACSVAEGIPTVPNDDADIPDAKRGIGREGYVWIPSQGVAGAGEGRMESPRHIVLGGRVGREERSNVHR